MVDLVGVVGGVCAVVTTFQEDCVDVDGKELSKNGRLEVEVDGVGVDGKDEAGSVSSSALFMFDDDDEAEVVDDFNVFETMR